MRLAYDAFTVDLLMARIERPAAHTDLTTMEVRLLAWLHAHADRWVPHEELLRHVWGYASSTRTHTVRSTVNRLRNKLEAGEGESRILRTKHGAGYRLIRPPAAGADRHTTPLIGRDAALAEVAAALSTHQFGLVTGVAGIGKTRLSRAALPDACTVALRDVVTPAAAWLRLAAATGIRGSTDRARRVCVALARAGGGVVLDDVDHLGLAVETVASRLVQAGVPVIATAMTALELEAPLVRLGPLAVDDAVQVLAHRCPGGAGLAAVAEAVDGVPLGLHLAAGSLDVLTPAELVDQLRDYDVAPGIARAMAVAWGLCGAEERRVLHQLTVFREGWSAEAASAIVQCTDPALAVLRRLRRRSVVHRSDQGRFCLLYPVRALVRARAGAPDEAVVARYTRWFARQGERHVQAMLGRDGSGAAAWLEAERANLVAASRHASAASRPEATSLLVVRARAAFDRGVPGPRDELEAALARLPAGAERARAAVALGLSERASGSAEAWLALCDGALRDAQEHPDLLAHLRVEHLRALQVGGHDARAEAVMDAGPPGAPPWDWDRVCGDVWVSLGRAEAARAAYQAAVDAAADAGAVRAWAWGAVRLAGLLGEAGDHEAASGWLGQVLDTARAHPIGRAHAAALAQRGRLAADAGRLEEADRDLTAAAEQCEATGDLWLQARTLFRLGVLRLDPVGADALGPLQACSARLAALQSADGPLGVMAQAATALATADAGDVPGALGTVADLAGGDHGPALSASLALHHAGLLAWSGAAAAARTTAAPAYAHYRKQGPVLAEAEASSLLARLGDASALDHLRGLESPKRSWIGALVRAVGGRSTDADRGQWFWVRLLDGVPT